MKKYLSLLVFVMVTSLSLTTEASLHKFLTTSDGQEIQLESFKDFLRGNGNPQQNTWWTAPSTGQKIFIKTNPVIYRSYFTQDDITNLIVLPSSQVTGQYQNTGWSNESISAVAITGTGPVLPGFNYFCVGTIAKAKTNCANIQFYYSVPEIKIPITPPPAPKLKMCWGYVTMGEERLNEAGDLVLGKYSLSGNYYYHYKDKSWWQKIAEGEWEQICLPEEEPEPVVRKTTPVKERVIYVDRYVERPQQYVRQEERRSWGISFNYIPDYRMGYQRPIYSQQRYYQEPQRQYYYRQEQKPQPQQWHGQSFDRGNQYFQQGQSFDRGNQNQNWTNGQSFDTGNNGNYVGNGGSFDGSGRIPGIRERVR